VWPIHDRSADPAARREFETAVAGITAPPARWHLKYVGVDPAFQRRGVGGLLVGAGMEMAYEEGVPVMLEASPNGKRLYEKMGFVVVGEMVLPGAGVAGPVMRWDPTVSGNESGVMA
jgi:ribosomal protein S18 acetylase RimI-like enzyme